jgi:hypothetical protein
MDRGVLDFGGWKSIVEYYMLYVTVELDALCIGVIFATIKLVGNWGIVCEIVSSQYGLV